MSKRNFWKYSANGNHFVLLDGLAGATEPTVDEIKHLCDPIFGVGADGVALISKAETATESYRFRLWNADGGEAEMCGNAARIAAQHFMQNHSKQDAVTFKTMNGVYVATLESARLWLKMTEKAEGLVLDPSLFQEYKRWHVVNTGVPHLILQVQNVQEVDLEHTAPFWRFHSAFPRGTNVDFISVPDEKVPSVNLRVYERGVEGETWSCGTGVAAVAWACQKFFGWDKTVTVQTKGGAHQVRWDSTGSLWYSGEIKLCFSGHIEK